MATRFKMWDGETWFCVPCQAANAVLRRKCRFCGAPAPVAQADASAEVE